MESVFVVELRVASVDGELVDQNTKCLQIGKRTQIGHPRCDTGAMACEPPCPNATYTVTDLQNATYRIAQPETNCESLPRHL